VLFVAERVFALVPIISHQFRSCSPRHTWKVEPGAYMDQHIEALQPESVRPRDAMHPLLMVGLLGDRPRETEIEQAVKR
jgi:hypothetical protein